MKKEGGLGSMRKLLAVCLTVNALLIVAVVVLFARIERPATDNSQQLLNSVSYAPSATTQSNTQSVSSSKLSDVQAGQVKSSIQDAIIDLEVKAIDPLYKKLLLPWTSTYSFAANGPTEHATLSFDYPEPAKVLTDGGQVSGKVFSAEFPSYSDALIDVTVGDSTDETVQKTLNICTSKANGAGNITVNGTAFCRYSLRDDAEGDSGRDTVHYFYSGKDQWIDFVVRAGTTYDCFDGDASLIEIAKCHEFDDQIGVSFNKLLNAVTKSLKITHPDG